MTTAINQNLSIYLPRDLAERVEAAKVAGTLDPKEVCKRALSEALDPPETPFYAGGPVESHFQVHWVGSGVELQALLDHVTSTGGFPQSLAISPVGKFALLVAWPEGAG